MSESDNVGYVDVKEETMTFRAASCSGLVVTYKCGMFNGQKRSTWDIDYEAKEFVDFIVSSSCVAWQNLVLQYLIEERRTSGMTQFVRKYGGLGASTILDLCMMQIVDVIPEDKRPKVAELLNLIKDLSTDLKIALASKERI